MRLGVALWADRNLTDLARLAVGAERAGFDDVWWPDHYMHRDIGAILTACAIATRRVRLGSAVTSPLLRHPAALASLFASLAEIAPGRIVAGVGPGGWELPVQLGIDEPKPRTITRQAAIVMAELLKGRAVTAPSDARRFPVSGAQLDFTPPQPVPLYLAARGPRMMTLAGELADGLITHSLSLPFIEHVVERVEFGVDLHHHRATVTNGAPDRQAGDCSIAVWVEVFLHDDLAYARNVLRPRCKYMVGGEFDPHMIPLYGLDTAEVMHVRKAVRGGDAGAHELITDEMVDAFSICGSVDRAADRIRALEAAGVSELILSFGPGVDTDEIASVGETMLAFREGLK